LRAPAFCTEEIDSGDPDLRCLPGGYQRTDQKRQDRLLAPHHGIVHDKVFEQQIRFIIVPVHLYRLISCTTPKDYTKMTSKASTIPMGDSRSIEEQTKNFTASQLSAAGRTVRKRYEALPPGERSGAEGKLLCGSWCTYISLAASRVRIVAKTLLTKSGKTREILGRHQIHLASYWWWGPLSHFEVTMDLE
jgi:hypothetical protein